MILYFENLDNMMIFYVVLGLVINVAFSATSSEKTSSIHIPIKGGSILRKDLTFLNKNLFKDLPESKKSEIIWFDYYNAIDLFFNSDFSDNIIFVSDKYKLEKYFKYLSEGLAIIITDNIVVSQRKLSSLPILTISSSDYDEILYYCSDYIYGTQYNGTIIFYKGNTIFTSFSSILVLIGIGLTVLISLTYFLRSFCLKEKFYLSLHSMLNRIAQIMLVQLLIMNYHIIYNNDTIDTQDFENLIELSSIFLYSFYKSLLLILIIYLSMGWSVLYFQELTVLKIKSYSIAFFLVDALIEIAIKIVVSNYNFTKKFEYYCDYVKIAIEFGFTGGVIVYNFLKHYGKLKEQTEFEITSNSIFSDSYKLKLRTMKLFYIISVLYVIVKLSIRFVLNSYFPYNTETYLQAKVIELFVESIIIVLILLIFFPIQLPKYYMLNVVHLHNEILFADVSEYSLEKSKITNEQLRKEQKERHPIVIVNPYYTKKDILFDNVHLGLCFKEDKEVFSLSDIEDI